MLYPVLSDEKPKSKTDNLQLYSKLSDLTVTLNLGRKVKKHIYANVELSPLKTWLNIILDQSHSNQLILS